MQGLLLAMCIAWRIRQGRLGIDDFGVPFSQTGSASGEGADTLAHTSAASTSLANNQTRRLGMLLVSIYSNASSNFASAEEPRPVDVPDTGVPLTAGPSTPGVAIKDALKAAVQKDLRGPATPAVPASNPMPVISEEAPLLAARGQHGRQDVQSGARKQGWWKKVTGR
jgi:hypothetical protein